MTMKSVRLAAMITGLAAFGGAALAQSETLPGLDPHSHVQANFLKMTSEEPGARIPVAGAGCLLVNNVWDPNATPAGFTQQISVENRDRKMLPGWRWNAPGERTTVLSMPELVCGDKPWDEPQKLRPEFPFHPGDRQLTADFAVELKANGRHNMAFSLWAVSKLPAVKQNIALEVMIWNVNGEVTYAAAKTGSFTAGGTTFDVYVKADQGVVTGPDPFTWKLAMFVARKPFLSGQIDFTTFLDCLLAQHLLKTSDYITSLELGTEIASGSGSVTIKRFEIGAR